MSYPHINRFTGSAGQSFACFLTPGMNIRLIGEANDYVGKVCWEKLQLLSSCLTSLMLNQMCIDYLIQP